MILPIPDDSLLEHMNILGQCSQGAYKVTVSNTTLSDVSGVQLERYLWLG